MASPGNSFRLDYDGARKRRLEDTVHFIAGVNPDDKSKALFLPITDAGVKIDAELSLPIYNIALTYYGSTNNVHTATYRNRETDAIVAVITLEYVNDGEADNDRVSSVVRT